uniref:ribonuclease E n=1 Tax=Timspurckia oligopyrenoides TaxID=708627 RepID=UPI001FCD5C50|nr:ribonuclease E [Timspurckia oligopyrenoides]UNJ17572.1 ribonuclease E [Timspurckia oligopyrenoides]
MKNCIAVSGNYKVGVFVISKSIKEFVVPDKQYQVGDIYHGLVSKIFASINAAFIQIDSHSPYYNGFIHISDLGYLKRLRGSDSVCEYKIHHVLTKNQGVLVQISKATNYNKGPRLTANITLSGCYLSLMPYNNCVYVSKKILQPSHRYTLMAVGKLIQYNGIGIAFHASAEQVDTEVIIREFFLLKKQWFYLLKRMVKTQPVFLIYREDNLISNIIRDRSSDEASRILVDQYKLAKEVKFFINYWSRPMVAKLVLHSNSQRLIDKVQIKNSWKKLYQKKVRLSLGGYLIIEFLSAMTIIDINSGRLSHSVNSASAVLQMNLLAAREIVNQCILRNISGIILIDFIDMDSYRDKLLVLEYLSYLFTYDKASPDIVQFSELGIAEITRKRVTKSLRQYQDSGKIKKPKSVFKSQLRKCSKTIKLKMHLNKIRYNTLFQDTYDTVSWIRAHHYLP